MSSIVYAVGQRIRTHHLVRNVDDNTPITNLDETNFEFLLVKDALASPEDVTVQHIKDGYYAISFRPLSAGFYSLAAIVLNNFPGSPGGGFEDREFEVLPTAPEDEQWEGPGLCSLAQVRTALGLSNTVPDDDPTRKRDPMLNDYIQSVSEWIQLHIDYQHADHSIVPTSDFYDGNDHNEIVLRRWPVVDLETVKVNDVEIPKAEDAVTCGWLLDTDNGIVRLRGRCFRRGVMNVEVRTFWGSSAVPKILQDCAVTMVVYRFNDLTLHPNETYRMKANDQFRWLPDAMQAGVFDMLERLRRRRLA